MKKRGGFYPSVRVRGGGAGAVSQAGGVLLVEAVRRIGLDTALSAALEPWRKSRAVHDPGKVLLDLALAVALGGDCLSDVAVLRAEPAVFGAVASDPTVSRLVDALAAAGPRDLAAVRQARANVRERVWRLAGDAAPNAGGEVVVDIDGVLVLAHSEKEDAAATWKKTFGHHPLLAFVDHGPQGSGEPVAGLLRPGNAGSNTAADHITAARQALTQLPKPYRRGRRTLVRTDSAGGTHEFLEWLTARGRWLSYSVGMAIHQAVPLVPPSAWAPAVEPDGDVRDGAWLAELAALGRDGLLAQVQRCILGLKAGILRQSTVRPAHVGIRADEALCIHHFGHVLNAHAEPKRSDRLERYKAPLSSLGVVDDRPHLCAPLQAPHNRLSRRADQRRLYNCAPPGF